MTLAPLDIALDALAVARLVHFVQQDEMPVGWLRYWAVTRWPRAKATALLECPWCLSPYAAAAVVLARHRWPRAWGVAARILAASQVTGMLAEHGG